MALPGAYHHPILQMRKMRLRTGKRSARGHTVSGRQNRHWAQASASRDTQSHLYVSPRGTHWIERIPSPHFLSLSHLCLPSILLSFSSLPWIPATGKERGKKQWILEWRVPCHQGTLVIHSPPGSPRLKNPPRDIVGGMEAGEKWQQPPSPRLHYTHSWPGLLNMAPSGRCSQIWGERDGGW